MQGLSAASAISSVNTAQVEECTTTFLFVTAATDRPTAGCSQTVGLRWVEITSGKGHGSIIYDGCHKR